MLLCRFHCCAVVGGCSCADAPCARAAATVRPLSDHRHAAGARPAGVKTPDRTTNVRWRSEFCIPSVQIKKELADTDSVYDSEKLSERIAKLAGGVAVIKVRQSTPRWMSAGSVHIPRCSHISTRDRNLGEALCPESGMLMMSVRSISRSDLESTLVLDAIKPARLALGRKELRMSACWPVGSSSCGSQSAT